MATRNTLIDTFKDFAICLNKSSISCNNYSLGTIDKHRIVFSRLYYACFHKGLDYFPLLRSSTNGKKHKTLIDKLKASSDPVHMKLLPLIQKLHDLRVWADYNDDNQELKNFSNPNIAYYIYQIENEISL